MEQLGKLALVKDSQGKDLRYFLASQLSPGGVFEDVGERLFDEIGVLTQRIRRRIAKNSEGDVIVTKQVTGSVEDLDVAVRQLKVDFEEKEEILQACLQGGDIDPADPLRLELPGQFQDARESFERIMGLLEATKSEYRKVQGHFMTTCSKSEEFMLLWDAALFPEDVMIHPEKAKTVTPRLMMDRAVPYEDFVDFWCFTPKEKKKQEVGKGKDTKEAQEPAAEGKGGKGKGKDDSTKLSIKAKREASKAAGHQKLVKRMSHFRHTASNSSFAMTKRKTLQQAIDASELETRTPSRKSMIAPPALSIHRLPSSEGSSSPRSPRQQLAGLLSTPRVMSPSALTPRTNSSEKPRKTVTLNFKAETVNIDPTKVIRNSLVPVPRSQGSKSGGKGKGPADNATEPLLGDSDSD